MFSICRIPNNTRYGNAKVQLHNFLLHKANPPCPLSASELRNSHGEGPGSSFLSASVPYTAAQVSDSDETSVLQI